MIDAPLAVDIALCVMVCAFAVLVVMFTIGVVILGVQYVVNELRSSAYEYKLRRLEQEKPLTIRLEK